MAAGMCSLQFKWSHQQ